MKERMKSILFVLALALVFVGATKVTEASAEEGSSYPKVVYAEEYVDVKAASGSVYYQIVKKASDTTVKPANWVPAAETTATIGDAKIFRIDFSGLSNTKDVYIAYADSNTATTATVITVPAKIKSVKAVLNYETETISGGVYDVIASLDVKGVDKGYDFSTSSEALKAKKLTDLVVLGWKRGANGNWKAAGDFKTVDWEMMKASNTTLYLRVEQADNDASGQMDVFRYSKEAKIKIPKTAKAPTIKVDYKKQTVAIKSGMEFREVGDTEWIQVALKKNGGGEDVFDTEKGLAKAVSSLTMEQLGKKGVSVASGASVALEVRTAATDKKFASNIATVKFTAPAAAPVALKDADKNVMSYTPAVAASGSSKAVAAILKLDLSKAVDKIDSTYEYALVGANYDLAKVKFTKVPAGVVDLSSKIKSSVDATLKYTDTTGNKAATVKYLEATLLIRKAVVTTKGSEVFASDVLEIKLNVAK